MSLYDDLGVSQDASADDIKKAHRRRARKTHPDLVKGKEEEFHQIQRAYEVLSDPARRKQYDAGGDGALADEQTLLMQELARVMFTVINSLDPDQTDIVGKMRELVIAKKAHIAQQIDNVRKVIRQRERAMKRFIKEAKKDQPNIFVEMIRAELVKLNSNVEASVPLLTQCDEMLKVLEDYSYQMDYSGISVPTQGLGFLGLSRARHPD